MMPELKFTKGKWVAIPLGGCSTVLVQTRPGYNNTATPSYGYRENGPFCLAAPFQDDGGVRRDFVSFSHSDAHLIAAAPELYEALRRTANDLNTAAHFLPDTGVALLETVRQAMAVLAKARGEA